MDELSEWMLTFQDKLDDKTSATVFQTLKTNGFTSSLQLKLLSKEQVDVLFQNKISLGAKCLLMYNLQVLNENSPLQLISRRKVASKNKSQDNQPQARKNVLPALQTRCQVLREKLEIQRQECKELQTNVESMAISKTESNSFFSSSDDDAKRERKRRKRSKKRQKKKRRKSSSSTSSSSSDVDLSQHHYHAKNVSVNHGYGTGYGLHSINAINAKITSDLMPFMLRPPYPSQLIHTPEMQSSFYPYGNPHINMPLFPKSGAMPTMRSSGAVTVPVISGESFAATTKQQDETGGHCQWEHFETLANLASCQSIHEQQ